MRKIATIGFFDGVHRGHRFLFAQLQEYAKSLQLSPAIYTFTQHPKEVLTGQSPAMLTTLSARRELLMGYGEVYFLEFSSVQHLTAEQFMRYLYEEQGVDAILLGYDHHFGSDRLKGFSEYERVARSVHMRVLRAYECLVDGLPVSSSRVRKLLSAGQIEQVNRLLGTTYTLTGKVEHGRAIGAKLGYPTANLQLDVQKQLPSDGVYLANILIDGLALPAVVNVGKNPTVGNEYTTVEAHIMDYEGDMYGKIISIAFLHFLRQEKHFSSLDELQAQIKEDIRRAKELL